MAAAAAMARRGIDVTVFEAFDQPRPLGSGLLLQPSGLTALRALGLEEQARGAGAVVERLIGHDTAGRVVMDLDYAHWRAGDHGVGIHRAALFDLLHRAALEAGVTIITGARITAIGRRAAPVLTDAAGRTWGPFDLAVVADGANSALRRTLRPNARETLYPWGAVWANCPCPPAFAGALRQRYHRAEIMMGVLPTGGGQASLFWSLPLKDMDAFFAGDFDAWRTRAAEVWPEVRPLLDGLTGPADFARAQYRDVGVGRWNTDACIVIGDAAHGTSPQLGQGANLALIDAVELADRLDRGAPVPRTLDSYQAQRRRQTAIYQLASRALTPMFQSSGAFWPWVRGVLFVPVSRLPFTRRITAAVLAGVMRLGRAPPISRP
jgi:2-polyprenyl-6-methoxyphenol hydroxylase-like FAD-dependent oxidoreductase